VLNQAPRYQVVWGNRGIAPRIPTSALDGGEWSASRSRPLYFAGKQPLVPTG